MKVIYFTCIKIYIRYMLLINYSEVSLKLLKKFKTNKPESV